LSIAPPFSTAVLPVKVVFEISSFAAELFAELSFVSIAPAF